MGFTRARPRSTSRDVVNIHDANDVVFSIAAAFQICVQLIFEPLGDSLAEEGWMNTDFSF